MRLIDADELIAEIRNPKYPYTYDAERVYRHMIDNAPTVDAVPVVRCKDCRYWDKDDSDRELCMCKVLGTRTMPMCFCWAGLPWEDGEAQE